MKTTVVLCASVMLAGCAQQVRSISNSSYQPESRAWAGPAAARGVDAAFVYGGELNEFDVLGVSRKQTASDDEIVKALEAAKQVSLGANSSILLIQSGAAFPDAPMVAAMSKRFRVVPFSGVPASANPASSEGSGRVAEPQSYARSLRLAAARGGNDVIVCYWGFLECEKENLPTKTVSWMPGVNWLVPDETQHARIRLKVALVDVRSGSWSVFCPASVQDERLNRSPRRAVADQRLVESLKEKVYESGVKELVEIYARK